MTEQLLAGPREGAAMGRALTRASMLVVVLIVLNAAGGWLVGQVDLPSWQPPRGELDAFWIAMALLYVVVMALPFVPGIEIGLALMLLLGNEGIALVYLCTQLALALSFFAGRLLPVRWLARLFRWLRLERGQRLLACLEANQRADRLACLVNHLPRGFIGGALRHRHLTLAVALNLPGNAVIGGAGGIGMIAGASRLFSFARYCLLMAAATSPVPVLLLLRGAM